jgi:hypothetical protein
MLGQEPVRWRSVTYVAISNYSEVAWDQSWDTILIRITKRLIQDWCRHLQFLCLDRVREVVGKNRA